MATTTIPRDIELQEPLGRKRTRVRATEADEPEGYGDTSNKIWKLYTTESEKHDKALVDSWKSNADSMLIFTGLFSSIVASFLIETYKTLLPNTGSQTVSLLTQLVAQSDGTAAASPQTSVLQGITPSAIRVNVLMVLSLFFSVTSALVSTLIQQWAREYLQYSQPSASPHKRARVRAYLFDGLSQFQMRRLTYGVPVLLHLAVFLFFFALSEWLYSINNPVGATARYCLIALLAVYLALSVLPLIVRNAPYQTALTTPLQAIISLVHVSYLALFRLMRRSSGVLEAQKGSGLLHSIDVDRARALMREIKRRASILDRSAMHWLLQELDEDDMDTFLGGLPGYIYSPLTHTKPVIEGLREDGFPVRIREHFKTCVTSAELSQEASMSRASNCIKSLRLIFDTSVNNSVRLENDDIQAIIEYLEPLCYVSSTKTALRASCVRGLVVREFLFPFAYSDTQELQTKRFPDYLIPLCRVIRVWKTTEIVQWSRLTGTSPASADPLPSDQEMWADFLFDGPLINLAVLTYAFLSRASEEEVNLDMAWKTLEILLKALNLALVRASAPARARFDQVLLMARTSVSKHEGGRAQTISLLGSLETVISGISLAGVFAYLPSPKLPPRQIEAIFGKEQLRDSELLEVFVAHLPGFVKANTSETSTSFMEHLILENKLWEQLHVSLSKCCYPELPFPDKLRIIMAFYDILDVMSEVLKDSSKTDWHSPDFDLLIGHVNNFWGTFGVGTLVRRVVHIRGAIAMAQILHLQLAQFSMQRSRGEPLVTLSFNGLTRLVILLGLGSQEDREYMNAQTSVNDPYLMTRAEAILRVTLRDGPLSNFCKLGRMIFEVMLTDTSDLSSEDMTSLWTTLRRMLYTPHLPLANASREMWAKFDHLSAAVRGAVALKSSDQNAEKLQPLLEMIEELIRMRPVAEECVEETGGQTSPPASVVQNPWQPSEAPVPRSSRRVNLAGGPGPQTGRTMYPTHLSLVQGVNPTAEMNRFAPWAGAWIPPTEADPSVMSPEQSPTTSIFTTQPGPGPGTGIPYHYPPHAPPHVLGMSGPRRAGSLDTANMPIPLGYMDAHPYPLLSPFPFHLMYHRLVM